jgi:hypothetical protein
MTHFERIPYAFPTRFLHDPLFLAEKIVSAVLHTEELLQDPVVMKRLSEETKTQGDRTEIIDGSKLSAEELGRF